LVPDATSHSGRIGKEFEYGNCFIGV
jgi:hypothetical protein